jgi:hypothetical protein
MKSIFRVIIELPTLRLNISLLSKDNVTESSGYKPLMVGGMLLVVLKV